MDMDDFNIGDLLGSFNGINQQLKDHPEKLNQISTQLEITTNEKIIESIIITHIADYIHVKHEKNNGDHKGGHRRFL